MRKFWRDQCAQDLVEYGMIIATVGLTLLATVNQLSQGIVSLYSSITVELASIDCGTGSAGSSGGANSGSDTSAHNGARGGDGGARHDDNHDGGPSTHSHGER